MFFRIITFSLSTMLILLSTLFLPMFGNINWKKHIYLLCVFDLLPEKFLDFRRNIINSFNLRTVLKIVSIGDVDLF